ncbi:sce7726 family protein [Empedobacter brevis]|uniref:sce7726 family protein n=1 Tax=Empedobacter brevis TaxID=247 RepID=UPI0028AD72A8|nr:sce7726 family protein [Empedobacter brevis]
MDYSVLVKSYSALNYLKDLKELVADFYGTDKYNNLSKYELASLINSEIFNNYNGENILKYKIAKDFRKKKYVAAFEVKVKSSRADFLVINGDTKSFEIKSKIDTLYRLKKQTDDYGDVFEYNNVVVDIVHLEKVMSIIPEYYGIWYYDGNKKNVAREAKFTPNLNSSEQLKMLNKKELKQVFGTFELDFILNSFSKEEINKSFKVALKERYFKRWDFLINNWNEILPIDIQFFFNSNIDPKLIYS